MTQDIQRFEGAVMAVNSYLVHGPSGVVVIDGQLTVTDARALRAAVDATGKPLAGVLITHPHPDHYAGAGLIAGAEAPIVATGAVAAVIRRDDALKNGIVGPMMGDEWPPERRLPDQIVQSGERLRLAGLELAVRDYGPGESHQDSIWSLDDAWFIGDLLCPNMDVYLADGHYLNWLASIERLQHDAPAGATFYPGHGVPTDQSGIGAQHGYITKFIQVVASALTAGPDERRTLVVDQMGGMVTDHRLRFLMELSIEPMAAVLGSGEGSPG